MTISQLSSKTHLQYISHVKSFADFLGRSADKATTKDVHRYQLGLASIGTTVPTVNVSATALRFFFKVTLKRRTTTRKPAKSQSLNSIELSEHRIRYASSSAFASKLHH